MKVMINHTASGKMGVVGKIGLIQARHQKMVKEEWTIFQVFRSEDPYTHAHVLGMATQIRENERVRSEQWEE